MLLFINKIYIKKQTNYKVVLYLAIYCGYEQIHSLEREPYVQYIMGVGSPIPFQDLALWVQNHFLTFCMLWM